MTALKISVEEDCKSCGGTGLGIAESINHPDPRCYECDEGVVRTSLTMPELAALLAAQSSAPPAPPPDLPPPSPPAPPQAEPKPRLDKSWQPDIYDAVFAVAKNVSTLNSEAKMRVLLAVAVLFGLIKPGESERGGYG